jgi:hypothetical protein
MSAASKPGWIIRSSYLMAIGEVVTTGLFGPGTETYDDVTFLVIGEETLSEYLDQARYRTQSGRYEPWAIEQARQPGQRFYRIVTD